MSKSSPPRNVSNCARNCAQQRSRTATAAAPNETVRRRANNRNVWPETSANLVSLKLRLSILRVASLLAAPAPDISVARRCELSGDGARLSPKGSNYMWPQKEEQRRRRETGAERRTFSIDQIVSCGRPTRFMRPFDGLMRRRGARQTSGRRTRRITLPPPPPPHFLGQRSDDNSILQLGCDI